MESRGEKRITLNTLKRVFQQYLGFFYFSLGAVKLTFNEERKKEKALKNKCKETAYSGCEYDVNK